MNSTSHLSLSASSTTPAAASVTSAARTSTTMTTNNDNSIMDNTAVETAPKTKKKSVRWGENIEYRAPPVDILADGEARPSSTANERHPGANINDPNHHPHPQQPQYGQHHLTTAEIDGYSNYHRQRNQHQQVAQSHMLNNSMNEEESTSGDRSVCQIPGHTHIWKNCPENPRSKRYKDKGGKKNPPRAPTPPPGFASHGTAPLQQLDSVRPSAAATARAAPTSNTAFGEQQTHHRQKQQQYQEQNQAKKQPPPPQHRQRGPHAPCSLPGHDHRWIDCPNNPQSTKFCGVTNRDVLFGNEPKRPLPPSSHQQQQQQRHQSDFRGGDNVGVASANNGTHAALGDADVPDWRSLQQQQNRQQQQPRQWGNKSVCRIPGHSGHTWRNCPNNPNSPKFDGNFGSHLMLLPLGSAAVDNPSVATPTAVAAAASKEHPTHGTKSTMPSASSSSSSSSIIARPTTTSRTSTAPGTSGSADAMGRSIPRKGIANADLSRPIPRRTSSHPLPDTTATVPSGGGITADPHRTLNAADSARPMHQRTALVRPNTVAAAGGVNADADHLFNKTDSARPVPRKLPMANQQHPHQHIQSQQDPQSQQGQQHIEKTVTTGIRGRRKIHRAPVGTDAMPLRKHTSSRLLKVQKGKDSGGNLPDPHLVGEEGAEGCPDELSKLPEDGIREDGRGGEDDSLTSPASLQGTSNWWVEDSPPSKVASKKRKAPNTKKGKDKKKRKTKERRGVEGDRRGSAEEATVTNTGTSTSSPSTTSMTSTETSDLKGLKNTGVKNKLDIANAAIAALGCVDNGGANDTITYGDNDSGEDMSMSDDDDLPMISLGSFNGQGKRLFKKTLKFSEAAAAAAAAAANSLSSTPTASKPTTDVSEDSDMATYKAALAALGYDGGVGTADIGVWDKTSSGDCDYGEDISLSDDYDRPLISSRSSKGQGKKHRKATNPKPTSIDSVHVSKLDKVGESLDDNELEKDLFDDVEQKLVLAEKREHGGVINEAARLQRPLRTVGESGEVGNATRKKMKSKDKSSSSVKKRRESSSRPTQQSAVSVERPASWTDEEIRLYELGMQKCKNNWGRIASEYVKSRTAHQVREYARRCIGLASPSKQQGGTVNEQQQAQLGESTIPPPVSTDIVLSLPAKNTSRDEWMLLEKLQDAINIRGGNSSALTASPDHIAQTSIVAEYSYGAANVSEDADEDDDISAFITCNKCCLVFDNMAKAIKHEKICTFIANDGIDSRPLHGRVFRDKNTLVHYMHRRYLRAEPSVDGDRIYYCP